MHDRVDRGYHRFRIFGLEDISPHIDTCGALLDRIVGHGQGIELRELLAPRHDDGYRARGGDRLKTFLDIVRLDVLGTELGDDAAGEPEIFCVPHHVLAHGGNPHDRHAEAHARIDQLGHVVDGARLEFAADEDLNANTGGVEPYCILHIHCDLLVGQVLAQDARPAARSQHDRLSRFRRNDAAQDPARAEQGVA